MVLSGADDQTQNFGVPIVAPATGAVLYGRDPGGRGFRVLGLSALVLGADTPRLSLPGPYVTRGLGAVDRTVGACPLGPLRVVPASQAPNLSPLSFLFKHCSFSSPTGPVLYSFPCVLGRYRLRAWGSNTTRESSSIIVAIRVGQDRDSHNSSRSTTELRYQSPAEEDCVWLCL